MKRLPKTKNWFLKMTRRARGPAPAFFKFNPKCESLERRELLASTILFNPTGTNQTQPLAIGGLDWSPGNSLAVNSVPLSVGQTYQLDYQAALAGVILPDGTTTSLPGLNTTFQITAVASVTEVVTTLSSNGAVATFALAPTQSPNSFFEIYYNPSVVADNLTGAGFNVGSLILTASPDPNLSNSSNFGLALDTSGNPVILPFDQFNPANYPGILSVTGAGSAVINAPVLSFDPAFFETPVTQTSFNTSNVVPFIQTNPSAIFVGSPGGAPPNVTPNIGAINGESGPDFQFQADGNSSFTAPPTIATTASPNITLGTTAPTISDSLVLSDGNSPTGTITFTLIGPNGPVTGITGASQTVTGNGTYTASFTLPTTGTVAGTYTWSASYSGDANNSPASEIGNATNGEQTVVLPPPISSIATTASGNIPLGTTAQTISDSLVLSLAYFPTGTITFTLIGPNGPVTGITGATQSVNGNGTYTASTTLPTTGTVAGTYTWSASYSGDANNSPATEIGNATNGEQTVVRPPTPSIATTASSDITLGGTTQTISDSLVLSLAYFPTGSVTFTLIGPNGPVTGITGATQNVSGNGTYTASFTLPTTGTVAGTYTWSASYSGDANNSPATEIGNATNGEQTVVRPPTPSIATTASSDITLGGTTQTISDSLVLSLAYFPTGTITFTLIGPNGPVTGITGATQSVNGNGTYTASTTLPTTGTVAGTYTWSASYSGDANNSPATEIGNATNGEQTVVRPPTAIATTASSDITLGGTAQTISDSLVLSGGNSPTGTITFTLIGPNGPVTGITGATQSVNGNGTYTASTTLPTTGTVAGTYTWSASYSGDANNSPATEIGNATNGEQTVVRPPTPSIATTASSDITLGGTAQTISDSLVLSLAYFPIGTITFTLIGPNGPVTGITGATQSVNGNGTYTASTTLPTTGTVAGTYTWSASYSGDANNSPAIEIGNATNGEQTVVRPPTPTIATIPTPTSATPGTILKDSATLSGGYFPTGMITFTLVAPGGATVDTETVTVNGNGTYTTPTGYTLPTPTTVTGTYQWNATYTSGNVNNNPASDINSTSEQVMVCPKVVIVQRFGIHQQPTQIVVTFNGALEPAEAENINNYQVFTLGPDGKFTVPVPIASAVYNPANDSVTLTLAHSYNVHHLAEIVVTNPCPGGPPFTGVLNRKFSLGAIDWHGHLSIPKKTNEPGVLNPAVLPKRITLATRPAELRLAKKPSSGAFPAGTTNTPGTVNLPFASNKLTSATRRAELKLGRKTGPRASTAVKISGPTSGNRPKAGPQPSQSISAARKLTSHWTAVRDHGEHIRKSISRTRT